MCDSMVNKLLQAKVVGPALSLVNERVEREAAARDGDDR